MDRVILLKTQLVEAAKFARSKVQGHQRLATILLDNFIEIQLSGLIRDALYKSEPTPPYRKKYTQEKRKKIRNNNDELLKACVKENIITEDELRIITFSHEIRNNLYHNIYEENRLTRLSTICLQSIISKHQPQWKSARNYTVYNTKVKDPYIKKSKASDKYHGNSKEDWDYFLKKYFVISTTEEDPSKLLSEYLADQISEAKANFDFISDYFSGVESEDIFNSYLVKYSFIRIMHDKLESINEIEDLAEAENQRKILRTEYESKWRFKSPKRLDSLHSKVSSINKFPIEKGIEIYNSLKTEINLIYDAFTHAASDLDLHIQTQIDISRGK